MDSSSFFTQSSVPMTLAKTYEVGAHDIDIARVPSLHTALPWQGKVVYSHMPCGPGQMREGIYGTYQVEVAPQAYDNAEGTFKTAEKTKKGKNKYVAVRKFEAAFGVGMRMQGTRVDMPCACPVLVLYATKGAWSSADWILRHPHAPVLLVRA